MTSTNNQIYIAILGALMFSALIAIGSYILFGFGSYSIALISSIFFSVCIFLSLLNVLFTQKTIIVNVFKYDLILLIFTLLISIVALVLIIQSKRIKENENAKNICFKECIMLKNHRDTLQTLLTKNYADSKKLVDSLQTIIKKCKPLPPPPTPVTSFTSGLIRFYDLENHLKPLEGVKLRINGEVVATTDSEGIFKFSINALWNAHCDSLILVYFYKDGNQLDWEKIKLCDSENTNDFKLRLQN